MKVLDMIMTVLCIRTRIALHIGLVVLSQHIVSCPFKIHITSKQQAINDYTVKISMLLCFVPSKLDRCPCAHVNKSVLRLS